MIASAVTSLSDTTIDDDSDLFELSSVGSELDSTAFFLSPNVLLGPKLRTE